MLVPATRDRQEIGHGVIVIEEHRLPLDAHTHSQADIELLGYSRVIARVPKSGRHQSDNTRLAWLSP